MINQELNPIEYPLKNFVQPEGLDVLLFPHQIKSIHDMERRERTKKIKVKEEGITIHTKMGILGDIPGYGKSYSIVGLILNDKMEMDEDDTTTTLNLYHNNMLQIDYSKSPKNIETNLLVVSTSLMSQWESYFSKTELSIKTITTKKGVIDLKPEKYDVVLVSQNRFNELAEKFEGKRWKRFIYDEPTSVHITKMKEVDACFYWFISATYLSIFDIGGSGSNEHFLKSVFKYMSYKHLELLVVKNSENFIRESFKMPKTHYHNYECFNPKMLDVVGDYISPDIKEMIIAGNIKGAITSLGGNQIEGNDNLIQIVTKKKELDLKEAIFKIEKFSERKDNQQEVEIWKNKKIKLEKDIQEIKDKYKDILKDNCPICLDNISKPIMTPCCKNIFGGDCLMKCLETKDSCPMCREKIHVQDLSYIKGEKDEEEKDDVNINKKLTREQTIISIIKSSQKSNNNSRFIIFSNHNETFDTIRNTLKENNFNILELAGSKTIKDNILNKYRLGKEKIIFLNSKSNGAGINLEVTTDIILYHEMNEEIKTQVIGRANRIGRKFDLNVHQFI
jgi:SNF2 family DNA or RNA helicase